jgi:CBS domain containing-hemolysin-like protein
VEGEKADDPRAIDVARQDVVTCQVDQPVGELRERVAQSPYGFALVLGPDGVLLGRLRRTALEGDPDARADDVMEAGPSTTRPDVAPAKLLEKLQQANLSTAVLSDPDGRLMGVVRRAELVAHNRSAGLMS